MHQEHAREAAKQALRSSASRTLLRAVLLPGAGHAVLRVRRSSPRSRRRALPGLGQGTEHGDGAAGLRRRRTASSTTPPRCSTPTAPTRQAPQVYIPHERALGKVLLPPRQRRYPVFDTAVGKVGVYICYDRHFPEGWRALGLNGAQIVFNPSATSRGLSQYLWSIEQPAAAVANEYYVGAINRVGIEPLGDDDFYGQSYFVDRGSYVGEKGDPYRGGIDRAGPRSRPDHHGAQPLGVLPRSPTGCIRRPGSAIVFPSGG